MKRGFTLIELLIVVAIMATLTAVMFRIGAISADESNRISTVTRLQKLENCLSGYYSAFGSYPPVKVYGSRDIYTEVKNGVQTDSQNKSLNWLQIYAACRSQPLSCSFPYSEDRRGEIEEFSDRIRELAAKNPKYRDSPNREAFSRGFSIGNPGDFSSSWKKTDWREVQIFKFGLMSYLLPRYLVMMCGDPMYCGGDGGTPCAQWSDNNDMCYDATTGDEMTWKRVYEMVQRNQDGETDAGRPKKSKKDFIRVANMPSQAVCANWMPNLEGICASDIAIDSIYGVNIFDAGGALSLPEEDEDPPTLDLYSPGGKGGSWYMLDTITVRDAWNQELYYYSPPGAQSYILWSSGANCRTFPPWLDTTGLMDQRINEATGPGMTVAECIGDDIIRMKH